MKPAIHKQNGPTWRAVWPFLREGRVVIGIDEVGRGAWAGPVVAAAVILPPRLKLPGINDSKLLTPKARERLNREIRRRALAIGIGWVSAAELDAHGLSWAVRESGLRSLAKIETAQAIIILDGKHNYLRETHRSQAIVKADGRVVPVAAASIIAKVARDRYMATLSQRLPGYGFEQHKGYGTQAHRLALARLGPSQFHRRSWTPFTSLADVNH